MIKENINKDKNMETRIEICSATNVKSWNKFEISKVSKSIFTVYI